MVKLIGLLFLFSGIPVWLVGLDAAMAKDPPVLKEQLDFARGDQLPKNVSHDWNLGPIGARGWCQVSGGGAAGSTRDSRQILITKITPGQPASEFLQQGDVIVGIGKALFTSDARIEYAKAISDAEAKGGKLALSIVRQGKAKQFAISLSKRPRFTSTAPFKCRKSQQILRAGCDRMASQGIGRPSLPAHINALALLATGDVRYRPVVQQHVQKTLAAPLSEKSSLPCWSFSFTNLFLSEYFLSTGDRTVLPEIRRLTGHLVRGQGPLGTWGHSFVDPKTARLRGYGAVNAVGLPVAISLVLARECDVDVEGLDESIALAAKFFRRHVGLGAIPYGDGPPNQKYGHDDNGKNSAAAIFFSLLDDANATEYYTRTAIAAHGADREQGHTGNFFNMLWSLPAVGLAGPEATGQWLKEFGWYYDLARDPGYRFAYQGYPREKVNSAYAKWNCPGAYLMHFAVPLRKLRITGRGVTCGPKLSPSEIAATIACGKIDYRDADQKLLLASLSSWSPAVRNSATKELRRRKLSTKPVARHNAKDPLERIAALRSSRNFDLNAKLLADEDIRVRVAALRSLAQLNKQRALAATFHHLANHPEEVPVFTQTVGDLFFPLTIRAKAAGQLLMSVSDREVAYVAIKRLLNDEDALVASRVAMGLSFLPHEEVLPLLPLVYEKAKQGPVGNVMFANKLRVSCAEVLTNLQLREGMEVSAGLLTDMSWGKNARLPHAARLLVKYQGHAKAALPQLRDCIKTLKNAGDSKWKNLVQETIAKIEGAAKPNGTLQDLAGRS